MIIAENEIDIKGALSDAFNILKNSKKVVIASHRNPDGDAVGST
jgi:nanoRNase/pAp phosphatase (c-di-AMP/oligoRNAs hydrolase)